MKLKDLEYRVNYLNKITKNRVEKHLPYKINNEISTAGRRQCP